MLFLAYRRPLWVWGANNFFGGCLDQVLSIGLEMNSAVEQFSLSYPAIAIPVVFIPDIESLPVIANSLTSLTRATQKFFVTRKI